MMKKILTLSIAFALFSCVDSHKPEAELVADCKNLKIIFDEDWNTGKQEKYSVESDSILLLTEEILSTYPTAAELPDVLYNAGDVASRMAMFDKSVNYYSQFVEKFPKHENAANAMWLLGYQYELMGNPTKAVETFQTLRKNYPDSPWEEASVTKIMDIKAMQERSAQDAENKKSLDSLDASIK